MYFVLLAIQVILKGLSSARCQQIFQVLGKEAVIQIKSRNFPGEKGYTYGIIDEKLQFEDEKLKIHLVLLISPEGEKITMHVFRMSIAKKTLHVG